MIRKTLLKMKGAKGPAPKGKVTLTTGKRPKRRAASLAAHAAEVLVRLKREHPDAHCELDHKTPLQLLVATILSAQCTDKRVNMVTPLVFRTFPTAAALADAEPEKLQDAIRSTGFFNNKTKSLIGLGKALVERHEGEVPKSMAALVKLPGVGRKTANVVLGNAFHRDEGVVVDTHVARVSLRLGLTKETDPVKIERDLMLLFPREEWTLLAHLLIFHGRRVCHARVPHCEACMLADICPSSRV